MTQKYKVVLSVIFFVFLTLLVFWGFYDEKLKMQRIDKDGDKTIGTIIRKGKPYKGAKVLVYQFFVRGKKYEGSRKQIANADKQVGDKLGIEYEIQDPTNSRIYNFYPNSNNITYDSMYWDSIANILVPIN